MSMTHDRRTTRAPLVAAGPLRVVVVKGLVEDPEEEGVPVHQQRRAPQRLPPRG